MKEESQQFLNKCTLLGVSTETAIALLNVAENMYYRGQSDLVRSELKTKN